MQHCNPDLKIIIMAHALYCWDIIQEGRYRRQTFAGDLDLLANLIEENNWHFQYPRKLDNCVIWENKTLIITDPFQKIVLATKNMFDMNGYLPHEVIGKTPRLFQGPATTKGEKQVIRTAIQKLQPFDTLITNYRKDGNLYKCHIEGYPVFNNNKELVNFIALENIHYG